MERGSFFVTENNGGGITFFATDNDGIEFVGNNYELNKSQLFNDIYTFIYEGLMDFDFDSNLLNINGADNSHGDFEAQSVEVYISENRHETTKTIIKMFEDNTITIHLDRCGNNGKAVVNHVAKLFELGEDCPKLIIRSY